MNPNCRRLMTNKKQGGLSRSNPGTFTTLEKVIKLSFSLIGFPLSIYLYHLCTASHFFKKKINLKMDIVLR